MKKIYEKIINFGIAYGVCFLTCLLIAVAIVFALDLNYTVLITRLCLFIALLLTPIFKLMNSTVKKLFGFVITYIIFTLWFASTKNFVVILFPILFLIIPILYGLFIYAIYYIRFVINKIYKEQSIPYKTMDEYQQELTFYMQNNLPLNMLENDNVKVYFNNYGYGDTIRILNRKNNKMYEIKLIVKKDRKAVQATIWGIIQMYFNEKISFNGLRVWINLIDNIQIKQIKTPV